MKNGNIIAKSEGKNVPVVDVTGAGDIFAGTFLASLTKSSSLQESLEKGVQTATNSVTQEGVMHLFSGENS
ncbi:ribokinase [compost metagenome]